MDDYFEYERPLDFVSAAERRKVMKEAGGDEDKANEILLARANADGGVATPPPETKTEKVVDAEVVDAEADDSNINGLTGDSSEPEEEAAPEPEPVEEEKPKKAPVEMKAEEPKPAETPKPSKKKSKPPKPTSDDDLDDLGMDDF